MSEILNLFYLISHIEGKCTFSLIGTILNHFPMNCSAVCQSLSKFGMFTCACFTYNGETNLGGNFVVIGETNLGGNFVVIVK